MFQTTNQLWYINIWENKKNVPNHQPTKLSFHFQTCFTKLQSCWLNHQLRQPVVTRNADKVSAMGFLNFDDLEVSTPTQRWWIWYQICVWYHIGSHCNQRICIVWYFSMRPWFADAITEAIKKFKEIKHDSLQNDVLHERKNNFCGCFKSRNLLLEMPGISNSSRFTFLFCC